MKFYLIVISVVVLLVNISLIIVSLALPKWSTINDSKEMSLTGCIDCENFYDDFNFECLARTYCEANEDYGTCKVNKNLYKAGYAYLVLEVLSLLMALLLLEKQVIWMFSKEYGHGVLPIILAVLMILFHLAATVLWMILSDSKFSSCGSTGDLYKTPDVCVGHGPIVAITNIILMVGSVCYFIFIYLKRSPLHIYTTITFRKVLWLRGKVWLIILLAVLVLSYMLILISITTKSWVSENNRTGSLLRCDDCSEVSNLNWECLSGKECSTDDNSDDCSLFRRLSSAGRAYLIFEAMSLIFFMFFAQTLTALIKDLDYGIGILNYSYAILAMVFNLLACAVWFGISSAEFEGDSLSALAGPSVSVVSQFLTIPLSALFCVIYRFRQVSLFDSRNLNVTIVEKVHDVSIINNTMTESPKKAYIPSIDIVNN
jgi:hypothetical protein